MKIHKSSISLLFFAMLFFLTSPCHAENKTFVKEYTYQASELDSKVSCRIMAFEQLKRLLLEELGTYLESMTEVKNFQLTKDQITTLTAGIVSAELITEKWDGTSYYMKAKITADPQDVAKSVDKLRHDTRKTKELEETKNKAQDYYNEIQQLKKDLEIARTKNPQKPTDTASVKEYNTAIKGLSAADIFAKAYQLQLAGKNQEAINYYAQLIEIDPKDFMAYNNRGNAYSELGNNNQAISDYNKAIEIDPKYALAYYNRGNAYSKSGDKKQAISDYTKAIELDPKLAEAYKNRGNIYGGLSNFTQAVSDYSKAIEIDPQDANTYKNRGIAYSGLDNYKQAISDCTKAIELDQKLAQAYYWRGYSYSKLGDNKQAISDYTKAIGIDPKDGDAYNKRGDAYFDLRKYNEGISDFFTAAKLGNKSAQRFLDKKGWKY